MPVLVAWGPSELVRALSVRTPLGPVRVDPVVGLAALELMEVVTVAPPVGRSVGLLVGR
ncbi:hypothetical protein ACNF49_48125 [Actinomadura sp. ATCC 39365]